MKVKVNNSGRLQRAHYLVLERPMSDWVAFSLSDRRIVMLRCMVEGSTDLCLWFMLIPCMTLLLKIAF